MLQLLLVLLLHLLSSLFVGLLLLHPLMVLLLLALDPLALLVLLRSEEFEFLLALLVHLQILGACLSRAHRVTRWARPVDRFLGWHSTGCVSGSVVGLIL